MTLHATRQSLLVRLRNRDDGAAWEEFDRRYRDLILAYCRRRGLQPADAEDVRQATMLSFANVVSSFEYDARKGHFRYYLGRIVQNAIHRHRTPEAAAAIERLDTAFGRDLSDDAEMDERWNEEWIRHHYRMAMRSLQETHEPRSVAMFEQLLAGRSVAEVARDFDTTEPAVHKVKQRIRTRLQETIAQQVRNEEQPLT